MVMDKKKGYSTVEAYIAQFPAEVQEILQSLRKSILDAAPGSVEKISYKIPTFYLNGNLVHFAAYPTHIGFYPGPSGIAAFEEELSAYKYAKGSVQFPIKEPLPFALIQKIVRFRVKENLSKAILKRRK